MPHNTNVFYYFFYDLKILSGIRNFHGATLNSVPKYRQQLKHSRIDVLKLRYYTQTKQSPPKFEMSLDDLMFNNLSTLIGLEDWKGITGKHFSIKN